MRGIATSGIRSSLGLFVAGVLVLGTAVTPAQAGTAARGTTTEEITVPATLEFRQGQNPNDPGNCSAPIFVQWADVPGTISATAYYTRQGAEESVTAVPPFDDTAQFVTTYTVQPGYHWIYVNGSSRDGPLPSTCEDLTATQRTIFTTPVRVVLTVERDTRCVAAEEAVDKAAKRVKGLRDRLRDATGDRRAGLKKKVRQAKRELMRAKARQDALC